jgi:hypothetical protein
MIGGADLPTPLCPLNFSLPLERHLHKVDNSSRQLQVRHLHVAADINVNPARRIGEQFQVFR